MQLNAWSSGLAAAVYCGFAIGLVRLGYARATEQGAQRSLLAAVVFSAVWGACGWAFAVGGGAALYWSATLADLCRYACWYAFLLIPLQWDRSRQPVAGLAWMAPAAAMLISLELMVQVLWALQPPALAEITRLGLFSRMALPVFALVLLEQVFRNVAEDSRWSIKPLCLGLAGIFMFDLYLYAQAVLFNHVDADTLSIRAAVHAMVVPLMALSVLRRNDWVARIRLSPRAVFHSAALLAAGVYLLFLSAVGYYVRYFGGEWGRALQQSLVFLGLVVLLVLAFSASTRARMRVLLGKHLLHYQFDYREEWLRFTHTLSQRDGAPEVGQQVIRGLANMLESPAGALWTKKADEDYFSETARWNLGATVVKERADSSLCRFLADKAWVINLEERRSAPERYGQLTLPDWLAHMPHAWLVIPLMVDDVLMGFCVLSSARTRMEVNWEVNDLLKAAGQQAAVFLAQVQTTEALLEARKFDAFNRMSAFVVHDLKNIVTQLSLMMKNAKRLGDNPEFQKDMLMTVENSLERMRQMLLQLRQGSTSPEPVRSVDLVSLLERVVSRLAAQRDGLEAQWSERLQARGHAERLERVVGHMVQNAIDATEGGGRVWIRMDRHADQARILIGDSGKGMSESFIQNQLFKPFQTTKPAGMGIGTYESLRYMQELGGSIEVSSTPGKGTLVWLLLPLLEQVSDTKTETLQYA